MDITSKTIFRKSILGQFLILLVSLVSLTILARPVQAQTSTPRDTLIKAIQEQAQRDVKLGRPAASVEALNILFGDQAKAVGVSMAEVLNIYEDAYTIATPSKSWLDLIKPEYGWIVAAFLFVLFIIRDIIKDNLTKLFTWLSDNLYKYVAGFRPFWWLALRRYRRALVKKYEELNIPFRPGKPLKMHDVYVPVKVAGTSDLDLLDARQAILKNKWLVVVGAPGSGKSMLLKNLTLTYAQGELIDFPTQPIPIYLELNRLNEANTQLRDHLVQMLDQNDFPNSDSFLEAGLTHGLLMLMFDGLDEVNSDLREIVINKIKDLLKKYPNCRAVVTCRSAVYNEEFADLFHQKLEIVEFSDQQIQRFLISWAPDMPSDKSVENLLRNLRERPRIMALARNPLLLSIIAYLYTDTEFVLPHSRAEFYDKSVNVLLEQWKEKRNRYKAAHKKLVLQHLALFNQDNGVSGGQDRRSIDLPTTLAEIRKILPSLTLKDDDAQQILDEIVERSGLMIEIDGGTKYQFTHLTLQEFFAALALEADVTGLMNRFEINKDVWRETIKLWCGLTHDSTQLIRLIQTKEPIMAFECLGDAQQVNAAYSEEITNAFKKRLGESGDNGGAIIRAFAIVVADPRPRGQKLFNFLVETLNNQKGNNKLRLAAAEALSLTNLPSAADALADYARNDTQIRSFFAQMGDLAVPVLSKWARAGNEWAFDALYTIGTPQAALSMIPLLWSENTMSAFHAAWRLVGLLNKSTEPILRTVTLTPEQHKGEYINWIWTPFNEPSSSALPVIVGRISYLLNIAPEATIPSNISILPDARIAIPFCAIIARGKVLEIVRPTSKKLDERKLLKQIAKQLGNHSVWYFFFNSLSSSQKSKILTSLTRRELLPSQEDWKKIFAPNKYEIAESWQSTGIKIELTILGLVTLVYLLSLMLSSGLSAVTKLYILTIVGIAIAFIMIWVWSLRLERAALLVIIIVISIELGPLFGKMAGLIMGIIGGLFGNLLGEAVLLMRFKGFDTPMEALQRKGLTTSHKGRMAILLLGGMIGGITSNLVNRPIFEALGVFLGVIIGSGCSWLAVGICNYDRDLSDVIWLPTVGIFLGSVFAPFFFVSTIFLTQVIGNSATFVFWLIWFVALGCQFLYSLRREREVLNPLKGLFDTSPLL